MADTSLNGALTPRTLDGKIAIVAGGGRDIGRACALRLAQAGAAVAINYHASAEGAESAVAEIEAAGGRALARQGDMTSENEVADLIEAATLTFGGGVDVLAHVTGGLVARKTIGEMDLAHWRQVMDLNLTSFFLTVRAASARMNDGGAIVGVASQAARDGGGPGAVAYAASKGAMMTMVRGLAKEMGPRIRVNAVCPGMIDTDFHNVFTKPEVRTKVAAGTPLRREGVSDDVAELVTFLASDQAAFVTGTNVDVNGGTVFS